MTAPNAELLEIYGTTKEAAEMPVAARIAAAVLGLGLMAHDKEHVEKLRIEASTLNEIARMQEAEKMEATISALKMASASGVVMARALPASELEKAAFGAFVGKAIKAVAGTPTRRKALAVAGTVGAGAVGYKGLSAARDYGNAPKGNRRWDSKRPVAHNVSQWGYPVR